MASSLAVLIVAALLAAAACAWVLRAYRRADGGDKARAWPALAACGVGAVAALGLYLVIGAPYLPDQPYATRIAALMRSDPRTFMPEEMLAVLHERSRAAPEDPRPHLFSGDILLSAGHAEEAARSYDAALRRDPRSSEAMLGLGRALVQVDQGRVSPQALQLFQSAAPGLPHDPTPWLYQAMAAMQNNNQDDARRFWTEAQARMAPDDPRRQMSAAMIGGKS